MKQHRFDPLSFIFGVVFIVIASVFAAGGRTIDLDAWVIPASILVLGVGLLLVSIRGLSGSSSESVGDDQGDQ